MTTGALATKRLEDIGFYTLTDERARISNSRSSLWRCELLITDKCNFACPYCRGISRNARVPYAAAKWVIDFWLSERLQNVRFSGGEPTLVPWLPDLIERAASGGARAAVSTNGSASRKCYEDLLKAGATDFSVSLDACCAETADRMSGRSGILDHVQESIEFLSSRTYVSVGVVLTQANLSSAKQIVEFAHGLGVADIRIIPSAQYGPKIGEFQVSGKIIDAHPILAYRLARIRNGLPARGISPEDSGTCRLALDDMAVLGGDHYPCIIALREGAEPIGPIWRDVRGARGEWVAITDTHKNRICQENCLDVCVAYNNRARELRGNSK